MYPLYSRSMPQERCPRYGGVEIFVLGPRMASSTYHPNNTTPEKIVRRKHLGQRLFPVALKTKQSENKYHISSNQWDQWDGAQPARNAGPKRVTHPVE